MPTNVLRDYVNQATALGKVAKFNTLTIKDHTATLRGKSFQHKQRVKLIQRILQFLPDFTAVLNEPDEPRVFVPFDILHNKHSELLGAQPHDIRFTTQQQQDVWNMVTMPCSPDSVARTTLVEPQRNDSRISFVSDLKKSRDICSSPVSFSKMHGFLASPSTFDYTQNLVPIKVTAKLSTFQDIMIPSSYYFQNDISDYAESRDILWKEKKDVLYWRGTGTGGH